MKEVQLTQGVVALVSDEDYEELSKHRWCASVRSSAIYAVRRKRDVSNENRSIIVYMHRQIMNCPEGVWVDHADRNTLNNQRSNLRLCTQAQNSANSFRPPPASTYRGVWRNGNGWCALISWQGKREYLGQVESAEAAARLYDAAAKRLKGEFATLNFPSE